MELLTLAVVVIVAWILVVRSGTANYRGGGKSPNELEQLKQDAPPAESDGNYGAYSGRTSTELDAVDPALDPSNVAEYYPSDAYAGRFDGLPSVNIPIEIPLASPRGS